MNIAHLILAHNNPAQLERLVGRLQHPEAYTFIHIDAKSDISQFSRLMNREKVYFIKDRVDCRWAGYSLVQAELNGFKEILLSGISFGYLNLISGSDYPIKSAAHIRSFLEAHPDRIFMQFEEVGTVWKKQEWRVRKYYLDEWKIAGRRVPGRRLLQKIMNMVLPLRKSPFVIYGRSQWFTIAPQYVQYVFDYIEQNPKEKRFFYYTWAPDEFFFQSILIHSPHRERMVNDNLRYINMTHEGNGEHPEILTIGDKFKLLSTSALYARKVDSSISTQLMAFLDSRF